MRSDFAATLEKFQGVVFGLYVISLATTISGMEIFSVLLTLLLLIQLLIRRPKLKDWEWPPWLAPLLLFVGIAVLGIVLGDATPQQKIYDMGRMRFFVLYAVLFYTLRFFVKHNWLPWLFIICAVIGIYGFIQHFVPLDLVRPEGKKIILYAIADEKIGPLVLGTFNHHLTFSNIYLFYACVLFSLALFYFPKKPWLLALALLIYLDCIWTESRAAWVAVPITFLAISAERGWKWVTSAVIVLCLTLAASYATDSGFRERLERTFIEKEGHYSLSPRKRLWNIQWEIFKDHPILGVGYNNNERQAKTYFDRMYPDVEEKFYGHAHSTPLQILSTTGLLGSLAYIWLWWQILWSSFCAFRGFSNRAKERALSLAVLVGFVGFHIQGFTQWNFGDAEVLHNLMFFWAVAATLWSASQNRQVASH